MHGLASELTGLGARLIGVGFSPAPALSLLADHLGWAHPLLADPDRRLYARLGLGRARRAEVYSPGTMRIYREARARGQLIQRPVEDPLQLGGDAVIAGGLAVKIWRPGSPDARPAVADLLEAVRGAAGR